MDTYKPGLTVILYNQLCSVAVCLSKPAELRDDAPQQLCWSRVLGWSIMCVVRVVLLLLSTYSSAGDSVNMHIKSDINKYKKLLETYK